jgi:ketosteroid isomerase-like protein
MDREKARTLAETYFDCLDTLDYETLIGLCTEDITIQPPSGEEYTGIETVETYYLDKRGDRASNHDPTNYIYGDHSLVVEGTVQADVNGTEIDTAFCDVIDIEDDRIARVSIYTK